MKTRQQRLCVALAFTSLHFSGALAAEPGSSKAQCLQAYSDGQRARKNGEFATAGELFAFCGGETCPAALHGDCQRWLTEVERATPTAVFLVSDQQGQELSDVAVQVDGRVRPVDGRALEFDAGEHDLTFQAAGYESHTQRFNFTEGEKLVAHRVSLVRSSQPIESSQGPSRSLDTLATAPSTVVVDDVIDEPSYAPAWVGAGVGVVGLAGFGYFGMQARAEDKKLSDCSPNCSSSQVQRIERDYLFANVSLGVGALGLLGAAAWLVFAPGKSDASHAAQSIELKIGADHATITGSF
jgi:hypothetical protein